MCLSEAGDQWAMFRRGGARESMGHGTLPSVSHATQQWMEHADRDMP